MELRDRLRQRRARNQSEAEFEPDIFTRVVAILDHYGMRAEDLAFHREPIDGIVCRVLTRGEIRKKKLPPILFGFAHAKSFSAVKDLLDRLESPYLRWAGSPEDLLLSRPLFALHSQLPAHLLSRYSFAFLYRFYAEKRRGKEDLRGGTFSP
ncbi:MAG: hypothetical protein WHS46_09755 [Desulfosoma sp.]